MIDYSQVSFRVSHIDDRTIFTTKILISFVYLYPYSLVLIRRTYIFINIVEATEHGTRDLELSSECITSSSGYRTPAEVARCRSQLSKSSPHHHIHLTCQTKLGSGHSQPHKN